MTFGNNNDIIVYTFEQTISYTRKNQYIVISQSIWWIASGIGLQQRLMEYIDTLNKRSAIGLLQFKATSELVIQEIFAIPRDFTEEQRAEQIIYCAKRFVEESESTRNTLQRNRVDPLLQTKNQPR
jgi:hypothetical protein